MLTRRSLLGSLAALLLMPFKGRAKSQPALKVGDEITIQWDASEGKWFAVSGASSGASVNIYLCEVTPR